LKLLARSKKKRIIKKVWKRTGFLPVKLIGKKDGSFWYEVIMPGGRK